MSNAAEMPARIKTQKSIDPGTGKKWDGDSGQSRWNQCKEIEENNRMGKMRDLFKKIRDTKGTFHVKMGSIKDINDMEVEDIKKRWQEYTEELYKKIFTRPR